MANKKLKLTRVGRNVHAYGDSKCHPGAIVAFRPDLIGTEKMIKHLQLTEPFEENLDNLSVCSDDYCEGVYMLSDVENDWTNHLRCAHGEGPRSRVGELKTRHSAQVAAFDRAVAKETESRAERESLEAEVTVIKREIEAIGQPKKLPAKKTRSAAVD